MRDVYFGSDNIVTSLGLTTEENAASILDDRIGITLHDEPGLYPAPVRLSTVPIKDLEARLNTLVPYGTGISSLTRLERMMLYSILEALRTSPVRPSDPRTLLLISSTKGNIDLLKGGNELHKDRDRIHLWRMAEVIAGSLEHPNNPIIVCNACISGSVAILLAARMIRDGRYDHAIVAGGDLVSEFVVSGFQSFQALSPNPCRPFDSGRDGLSLGEGAGTVVLSADPGVATGQLPVSYLGGGISNDANHISGPSRDGEGLLIAIKAALDEAKVAPKQVDFISAHGTGTLYNDEMESLAMAGAGLAGTPLNSFKGYFGHTLGAAGIIESVLTLHSMRNGILFKTAGYERPGTTVPVNVLGNHTEAGAGICMKTASGFGGCNAALIFGKA